MRCTASLSRRGGACSAQTLVARLAEDEGGALLGLLSLARVMALLMSSALLKVLDQILRSTSILSYPTPT